MRDVSFGVGSPRLSAPFWYLFIIIFFLFVLFLFFKLLLESCFVDVPLIFSCPAETMPRMNEVVWRYRCPEAFKTIGVAGIIVVGTHVASCLLLRCVPVKCAQDMQQ